LYRILFFNFNPQSVHNLHLGFKEVGHTTFNYQFNGKFNTHSQYERLAKRIKSYKPDVAISYGWWKGNINLNTFCDIIDEHRVFHVFWAFDDPECLHNISLPIGKRCRLVFTTVEECIEDYRNNGIDAHLLLHGCHPPTHKKVAPVKDLRHDLVLLGHNYNVKWARQYFAYRMNGINNIVRPLADKNYDLMVWGLWWNHKDRIYSLPPKNYGQLLPYARVADIYSSAKISLGLQSVGNSNTHLSVRTFEALGCGSFHLSQYSPALEHLFKKGVHLEWSNSPEETLDLVNFYLTHAALRNKIAQQGQAEVYANHTLKHRAQSMMEIIGQYIR